MLPQRGGIFRVLSDKYIKSGKKGGGKPDGDGRQPHVRLSAVGGGMWSMHPTDNAHVETARSYFDYGQGLGHVGEVMTW